MCVRVYSVVSDSLGPHGCSLPGSSVHGILQARILEWVAISFSNMNSVDSPYTIHILAADTIHWCKAGMRQRFNGYISSAMYFHRQKSRCKSQKKIIANNLWVKWSEVDQSCLTLCDPMDCSLPGSLDFPGKSTGVGCHFLLQGII